MFEKWKGTHLPTSYQVASEAMPGISMRAMRRYSDIVLSSEEHMMMIDAIQTDTVTTAGLGRLMWTQLSLILSRNMLEISPSHSKHTFSEELLNFSREATQRARQPSWRRYRHNPCILQNQPQNWLCCPGFYSLSWEGR